jgi:hypothetical protein
MAPGHRQRRFDVAPLKTTPTPLRHSPGISSANHFLDDTNEAASDGSSNCTNPSSCTSSRRSCCSTDNGASRCPLRSLLGAIAGAPAVPSASILPASRCDGKTRPGSHNWECAVPSQWRHCDRGRIREVGQLSLERSAISVDTPKRDLLSAPRKLAVAHHIPAHMQSGARPCGSSAYRSGRYWTTAPLRGTGRIGRSLPRTVPSITRRN